LKLLSRINTKFILFGVDDVVYFDDVEEFSDLADWYLNHETERGKIADAGMHWTHERFTCIRIAGYILELVEKGTYSASWFDGTQDL